VLPQSIRCRECIYNTDGTHNILITFMVVSKRGIQADFIARMREFVYLARIIY